MESIGSRLKKIRKEKNLSLEQIKEKTKLSLNVIKALEEDKFGSYASAYIKGFLKMYCKFLEIDSKDLISEYERNFVTKQREVISKKDLSKKLPLPKICLKAERILIPALVILILFISFTFGFSIFKKKIFSKKQISLKEELIEKKEAKFLRLALRAKDDCWIKVSVDGKTVFQSILKKGRQESWQAKDKIVLDVGNAGSLILELDGKILSPLGRKGQVIKNILITGEGVSIGR